MTVEVSQIVWKLKKVFPKPKSSEVANNVDTNFVFRLHSHLTFIALMLFSILVFVQHLTNVHIKCLLPASNEEQELHQSAVTTYCFVTGTYTVENQGRFITPTAHPGVGPYIKNQSSPPNYHHYFQWVPFILLLQSLSFYFPHVLWKSWEAGRITLFFKKYNETGRKEAAKYFHKSLGYNKFYAMGFIFCEFLNGAVSVLNFFVTDWFLGGNFLKFGYEYLAFRISRVGESPMDKIFPKVTKCDFKKFGPSGQVVNYDIVCILAVNVINEKIFLILWFWYCVLFFLAGLVLIYRISLAFPSWRRFRTLRELPKKDHDRTALKYLFANLKKSYGDWFMLKSISGILDTYQLEEFCKELQICEKRRLRDSKRMSQIEDLESDDDDDDDVFPLTELSDNADIRSRKRPSSAQIIEDSTRLSQDVLDCPPSKLIRKNSGSDQV